MGLINILSQQHEDEWKIKGNELSFSSELLTDFSKQYFQYFMSKYQSEIVFFKLLQHKNKIENYSKKVKEGKKSDDIFLTQEDINALNKSIKYFQDKLKRKSYLKIISLISEKTDLDFTILRTEELQSVNNRKKDVSLETINQAEKQIEILQNIIIHLEKDISMKYFGASDCKYDILNKFIGKISFLDERNCKEKDMYVEFEQHFVKPALEYLNLDKSMFKYRCFSCGSLVDIGKFDDSERKRSYYFLNGIGFDLSRKASKVWNFNYDLLLCPICKLIHICIPAGFVFLDGKALFVNYNTDLNDMVLINQRIYSNLYQVEEERTFYFSIVKEMQKIFYEDGRYQMQDVQVVRYYNEKYHFNLITGLFLNVVKSSEEEFKVLKGANWKENNVNYSVYDQAVMNLLSGNNLFLLIHRLMLHYLSKRNDCFYNLYHVYLLVRINIVYLREVVVLEQKNKMSNPLDDAKGYGSDLQESYGGFDKDGKYNKKLNALAYKMLNALKTNNPTSFMDTLINSYMYVEKPIPGLFSEFLDNNLMFKNIGYAFLTGMLGEKSKKDNKVDSGDLKQ